MRKSLYTAFKRVFRKMMGKLEKGKLKDEGEALVLYQILRDGKEIPQAVFTVDEEQDLVQLALTVAGPIPNPDGDFAYLLSTAVNKLANPAMGRFQTVPDAPIVFLVYTLGLPLDLVRAKAVPDLVDRALAEVKKAVPVLIGILGQVAPELLTARENPSPVLGLKA